MGTPRLSMRAVRKAFGDSLVLDGVDLELQAGRVHALLGENGAGKSTLVRILAGVHQADRGEILLDGADFAPASPQQAWLAGIATIHQELSVIPHLSVADNVMLGREMVHRMGFVDRRRRDEVAACALELLQHAELPVGTLVSRLSPASRQIVEIARALARDARVLIMDEPTSSLDGEDVERLLSVIEKLRERDLAVVYISHHLGEVRRVCDDVTVLRDGHTVVAGAIPDFDDDDLVRHMAGRPLGDLFPAREPQRGEPVLELRDLGGSPLPRRVSLTVHRGEIFGIGGLCGAGRTELLETLFGLREQVGGSARFHGEALSGGVARRWRRGMGLVVEDRRGTGLALSRSIATNITLPSADRLRAGSLLRPSALVEAATRRVSDLRVRCRGSTQSVGLLSGGNQQKVALARLLESETSLWLLDEPTRGIDVQSRQQIYSLLADLTRQGAAILLVSSQLPELLGFCDRIAVMREGVLGAALPAAEWTQESLLRAALGAHVTQGAGEELG
ncbi:MAG: sugar ABC transporter ATP-binding protein [Planctomycetota bacterium]|nr:sugar ABC transporter ATP-binding protein [Planctomycetota bacterium]